MLAQVANGFRADTARPHIPIGSDLRGRHTRQARNDLPLLDQRALHNVIVAITECLCNARNAVEFGLTNALLQALDHRLVLLNRRRNAHPNGIQFHALLRNLADEGIWLQFVPHKCVDVLKLVYIEIRDDCMHTQREVLIAPLQSLQTGIRAHGTLEIALDTTHDIMLHSNTIQ